jgi:hypothetical protein
MTEKAAQLVASKNLEESGTFKSDHNNNFAILNSVSSDYLEKNALDSKIQFNPEFGSNIQQISVLQASELVQAKLAEANIKLQKELEERKIKENNIIVGAEHAGSSIQQNMEGRMTRSKVKGSFLDRNIDTVVGVSTAKTDKRGRKATSRSK